MQNFLMDNHLTLEEMAGCSYCTKERNNCNKLDCAKYHFQFHFYLKWHKWIKEMMNTNNLSDGELMELLKLNKNEWLEFISGHINPQCYKNHNYLDELLVYLNCTNEDILYEIVEKKPLLKCKIKIINKLRLDDFFLNS